MTNIKWEFADPHLYKVRVVKEEIDGLMHSNNACYVRWCESAAWHHSELLGLNLSHYQQLDRAMAVSHAEYSYKKATYEGDDLLIGTWLQDMSAIQMKRCFQIVRKGDSATVLTASWLLSCIEISTGKPKRLPPEFKDIYGAAIT